MRLILIVLLFLSCKEEEVTICDKKQNPFMTISDSLPIQFWVNGQQTYNEKNVCGFTANDCFCQPFNCDDEIKIQFTDSTHDVYELHVLDTLGNQLAILNFIEIETNLWELSFTPSELSPAICELVQLKITVPFTELENPDFISSLSPWTNVGSGESWSYESIVFPLGSATINAQWQNPISSFNSTFLTDDFDTYAGQDYELTIEGSISVAQAQIDSYTGNIFVYFSNGSSRDIALSLDITDFLINEDESLEFSKTVTFTALNTYNKIEARLVLTDVQISGDSEIAFYLDKVNATLVSNLGKSDCIDLQESHDCTAVIEYTNGSNFDGIVYETSPQPTFSIRVPAIFFHEENPQEREDLELSNGEIVSLRQSIVEKRLLELGFMPPYMHKKIQKILMHDTVTIDSDNWIRRDDYESSQVKDYGLKKAQIWLTKINSIDRNII